MQITVKLMSAFMQYLPPHADGGAFLLNAEPPTSAHDIVETLKIPRAEVRLIMRNGALLADAARDAPLDDGDVVSVWPSIQGG